MIDTLRYRLTTIEPLLAIFGSKKCLLTHTANRLRRWGTILLNYNFKMEYLPSNKIGHTDGQSSFIPKYKGPTGRHSVIASFRSEGELKITLCNSVGELPVTLDQIKQESLHEKYINRIKTKILEKDQRITDVFSTCDDELLYRECVVIPSTMQKHLLKDFHAGHPGSSRMKSLMRSFVYWSNMDKDIENVVKLCKGSALAVKVPPIKFNPCPKTYLPWARIHINFVGPLEGYYTFIVVTSFSKWPEVHRCKVPTTEITMKFLRELFARFGVVDTIVPDNESHFTSREFKDFCVSYQIDHVTTAPFHPRSNEQAERFVDTLKRSLKKVRTTPTEKALQEFLQVYRVTLNNTTPASQSPAEVIFARRIRSVYYLNR